MALLQSADQLVNQTALARNGHELFDRVANDRTDRLVVVRKNVPVAVILNVEAFEDLLSELEDLRNQVMASRRLGSLGKFPCLNENEVQMGLL